MRLKKIGLERTKAQPDAGPVTHEMIAELVPLGHEAANKVLPAVYALANEEERRPRTLASQLRQDERRGSWIRPIVDRQGD
jgi:hypothetical protein